MMKIQTNTGHNVDGREAMARHVESVVESKLGHLAAHITRVEIYLSDENGPKGGGTDKRCVMEARLESHQPVAVTQDAASMHQAIEGAAEKLKHALDHVLDRRADR